MSRTNRGKKGAGHEYWSRRNHKDCTRPGRFSKTETHRKERRDAKKDAK